VTPTRITIPETSTRLGALARRHTDPCTHDPARLCPSHPVRDPSLLAPT
jgi:hypothetical protein